jgi:hypothetical protein
MVVCRFAFGAIACGYFAGRVGLVQEIWGRRVSSARSSSRVWASSSLDADWQALRPLLALATWAAFALEGLAPILLWVPRVGTPWATALLLLHAGLEIVDNQGSWQILMGASLLYFLPAPWVARWLPFRAGDRSAG